MRGGRDGGSGGGFDMARATSLRDVLRHATRERHQALDEGLSPLANGSDYPAFLALQHSARQPIEAWYASEPAILQPPPQVDLIAADLEELGCQVPDAGQRFVPQDHGEAIGIAWVLAGSSLGNKMLLKRRNAFDQGRATRFLADPAMPAFWSSLRGRLERPAETETCELAVEGARRAFDHFLAVASRETLGLAA